MGTSAAPFSTALGWWWGGMGWGRVVGMDEKVKESRELRIILRKEGKEKGSGGMGVKVGRELVDE